MPKLIKSTILSFILIIITIFITVQINNLYMPKYPYIKEYIPNTGNIKGNVISFDALELEIGANKLGYAVFKNPKKAWQYLKTNYQEGLKLIEKEYSLLPLNHFNYEAYKTYGWQVTKGSTKAQEEANFVSSFMDIYENSYRGY